MSLHRSPTVDLKALEDRLDELKNQRLVEPDRWSAGGTLASETTMGGNGHAEPNGRHRNADVALEPEAELPVPRLGAEAAASMSKLSKAVAEDIRQVGRLAFTAGKRVQEECEQMAGDVEANGGTVALHLTGLSQLLADVGMSNRETLHRLLGEPSPSIAPPAGNGHAAEQAAGRAKAMRPMLPGNRSWRTE